MDHFQYRDGNLFAEDVDLREIAKEVGTPVYVYSSATLKRHFRVFQEAFDGLDALICFAVKANSNQAVLKTLAQEGSGADVVSGGELKRALLAGIPAQKIVFSGVGKTPDEMRDALKANIKQFNVESEAELEVLNAVAEGMGMIAPVSVRVNPDVDAKTHAKISTGKAENKFGIPWVRVSRVYERIAELSHLKAVGVDVHIGSQLTDLGPFEAAFKKVVDLVKNLRVQGHDIQHIDLGGGLGIPYDPEEETPPSPGAYGAMIGKVLGDLDCSIILEPGRLIAGNAGILLTSMLYEKESENKVFYILDAAMNDLSRPAMYDAYHDIIPVKEPSNVGSDQSNLVSADFVGPVCETGDTFAKSRTTSPMMAGDLAVIKSAGAYGAVMASTYNSRALIPEVLVSEDKFSVIRKRQSIEDLINLDQVPDWLAEE
ncbi:diaminopimelate decarboxylase [Kordiimonas sp. SCSIO 12610]|uniref:diaminopimelate decarboxylase n=1 Tax=Kordiimonas sp. SCSIO 12610 TaxID=2829597 RepID=UPI00210C4155|nr:diaminopimelate decarboxylase [Kordiimonas sp. SCSIO 12610]UTW55146.1 diaminopimelate decarboxylase [Kordiimonas sp. SCSIO 12610]